MKRLVLASLTLMPLALGAAQAADMHVKALPPVVPVGYSWTGCYLGGYVGGAFDGGGSDDSATALQAPSGGAATGAVLSVSPNPTNIPYKPSFIGGGTLGCNYQVGVFVFGAEGEYGYMHMTSSFNRQNVAGTIFEGNSDTIGNWYGVAAARLGLANDHVMWYVKGGAAFTHVSTTVGPLFGPAVGGNTESATGSLSPVGWAAGAGVEWAFMGNWSWKAEGLVLGFNRSYAVCGTGSNLGGAVVPVCGNASIGTVATFKMGLNYKFDWGAPVVARY